MGFGWDGVGVGNRMELRRGWEGDEGRYGDGMGTQ